MYWIVILVWRNNIFLSIVFVKIISLDLLELEKKIIIVLLIYDKLSIKWKYVWNKLF